MADDITLNPGAGGDVVATEDVAGVEFQKVKLVDGTAASTTAIPLSGDLANGLDVDVTRVQGTVVVDGSAVTQPVSAASLPLPSGASTLAAQLADGHNVTVDNAGGGAAVNIQDGGNVISVDNGGTFAVQSTLQTGSDTVGEVMIGAATTAAGDLAKAEDAVHGSGDVGIQSLAVRADTLAAKASDGNYHALLVDELGALWVSEEPNVVDSTNSSSTPLGISGVFTGTATDVLEFSAITVNIDSDEDSAADGIQLQLSSDGTNWDSSRDFTYTAANNGSAFQLATVAQFFRVVYTNGGTGQGTFRLQTILHHATPITGTHRLSDSEDPDSYTVLTKSAIVAQAAGTGDFVPVQATAAGNLKMSIEEVDGSIAGGGVEATALRVTVASDSTGLLSVDNDGVFAVQVDAELPAGTQNIGDVDVASIAAGANLVGDVGIGVRTSGGTTLYKNIDVDESEDEVKGTAGQVYWIHAVNLSSAPLFLKFFNATAASVIIGTTVPDLTFPIPSQGDTNGAGFNFSIPNGIEFTTAITIAATTGVADLDAGAPGPNEVIVNLGFS